MISHPLRVHAKQVYHTCGADISEALDASSMGTFGSFLQSTCAIRDGHGALGGKGIRRVGQKDEAAPNATDQSSGNTYAGGSL